MAPGGCLRPSWGSRCRTLCEQLPRVSEGKGLRPGRQYPLRRSVVPLVASQIMRILPILLLLSVVTGPTAAAQPAPRPAVDAVRSATSLIKRVVPSQARNFIVEQIASDA